MPQMINKNEILMMAVRYSLFGDTSTEGTRAIVQETLLDCWDGLDCLTRDVILNDIKRAVEKSDWAPGPWVSVMNQG